MLLKIFVLGLVALDYGTSIHLTVHLMIITHRLVTLTAKKKTEQQNFEFSMWGLKAACIWLTMKTRNLYNMLKIIYLKLVVFMSKLVGKTVFILKPQQPSWEPRTMLPGKIIWYPVLTD